MEEKKAKRRPRIGVTTHPDFIGPRIPPEWKVRMDWRRQKVHASIRPGHPSFIGPRMPRNFRHMLRERNLVKARGSLKITNPLFIGPVMPSAFARNLRAKKRSAEKTAARGTLRVGHPLFIGPRLPPRIKNELRRLQNRDKVLESGRRSTRKAKERDIEAYRAMKRAWQVKNRDKIRKTYRAWVKRKMASDINFLIKHRLRGLTRRALDYRGVKKLAPTMDLLGCRPAEFKSHMESKFQPGMTWENYGTFGWHIDHIIPCAVFDLSNLEHQKICFHHTNLQPLWATQNLRKNDRITPEGLALINTLAETIETDGPFLLEGISPASPVHCGQTPVTP